MRRRGQVGLVSGSEKGEIRPKLSYLYDIIRPKRIFVLCLGQELFNVENSRPKALKEEIGFGGMRR